MFFEGVRPKRVNYKVACKGEDADVAACYDSVIK